MRSDKRIPKTYQQISAKPIVSGAYQDINRRMESSIKNKPLYAIYSEWNFDSRIWWDAKAGCWCCEIWDLGHYETSFTGQTLRCLVDEVYNEYGEVSVSVMLPTKPLIVH